MANRGVDFIWVDRFSEYCIAKKIISTEDVPWFKYGIEKRIYTSIVAIPFFLVAVILSDIYTAIAFYVSFYCLRTRINGYHAKTVWACFVTSLLSEFLFLGVIRPLINPTGSISLALFSLINILILAPYNHSSMHLSHEELTACRNSSRIRSISIMVCILATYSLNLSTIAKGLSLGLAMAACLLCLAYIDEWRKKNDNT